LLEKSVGLVTRSFRAFALGAGIDEVVNECPHLRPNVITSDELVRFSLAEMSGYDMIVFVLENLKTEIMYVWNINLVLE
jgi:hypothetical protein